MKKSRLVTVIVAVVVVAGAVFYACKKDVDNVMLKSHKSFPSNMRTFTSVEELFAEMETVRNMDEQELKNHEESMGFCSFGRMAESIYYPIAESITENNIELTAEQAAVYISEYPQYLEWILDEEGEYNFLPKYDGNPFRYVMNDDRMFRIEDNVYKVFKDVIITGTLERITNLPYLDEEDFKRFIQEVIEGKYPGIGIFCVINEGGTSGGGNVGIGDDPTPTYCSGKYGYEQKAQSDRAKAPTTGQVRVIATFQLYRYKYDQNEYHAQGTMLVRGQWRAGNGNGNTGWCIANKTLSGNITMEICVHGETSIDSQRVNPGGKMVWKDERIVVFSHFVNPSLRGLSIVSINGNVCIPEVCKTVSFN